MISIIAAMDKNFLIGKNNSLPWERIPADMKHFRETTDGHTVVMGRKTFASIGRPLPNRRNIVLTRDTNFSAAGCEIAHSVDDVLKLAAGEEKMFVVGGASVYEEFLPRANEMHITFIDGEFAGDSYFPLRDFSGWRKEEEKIIESGADTPYRLRFVTFSREPSSTA